MFNTSAVYLSRCDQVVYVEHHGRLHVCDSRLFVDAAYGECPNLQPPTLTLHCPTLTLHCPTLTLHCPTLTLHCSTLTLPYTWTRQVATLTLTYSTQRRIILEAVAFGSFLRDVETRVDTDYHLLTPAPTQKLPPMLGA